jgi:hypothetical protein
MAKRWMNTKRNLQMPDPVTAITGGLSLLSSSKQASAQKSAAAGQAASAQAGIDEQQRQFDTVRQLLQPFVEGGTGAFRQQLDLTGISGPDAQRAALASIQGGPEFAALTQQGENAILQNASATGGLRGGNTQAALAQFRPQMLSSLIEQQYSRLGGLASMGQNAAAGVGNAGMQTGANVSNLLQQQGAAQAGGTLAAGQTWGNTLGGFGTMLGQNSGAINNMFSGGSSLAPQTSIIPMARPGSLY